MPESQAAAPAAADSKPETDDILGGLANGEQPETKLLSTKNIFVDAASQGGYQRPVRKSVVRRIIKNFNPLLVNPIKVSYRDGKYWVFDGQHTLEALKVRNNGEDLLVSCMVFYGLTRQQEAALFIQQNGISTAVSAGEKMHARYNADDPDVKDLVRIVNENGLKIQYEYGPAGENTITAVSTLKKAYDMLGPQLFDDMLSTIHESWNGEPASLSAPIIGGMAVFFRTYSDEGFDRAGLVRKLQTTPVTDIIRTGRTIQSGGNVRYARAILALYNKSKSGKGRLRDKF